MSINFGNLHTCIIAQTTILMKKTSDISRKKPFKVVLYSVLNGLNHEDSAIKC